MVTYDNLEDYILSCSTIKERIDKIDTAIGLLLDSAVKAAVSAGKDEYWLNDGQTSVKTKFRNPEDITKAINGLNKLRNLYSQQCLGFSYKKIDSRNQLI